MVTLRTDVELKRLNDGLKGECFSKYEIEFWHADFFRVSATCQVALFDKYLSLVLLWKEVLHVKRINQTFFYLQFHTWPYSGEKKNPLILHGECSDLSYINNTFLKRPPVVRKKHDSLQSWGIARLRGLSFIKSNKTSNSCIWHRYTE